MPPIDVHPLPVAAKKTGIRAADLAELAERGDVAAFHVLGQWHFSDHALDALRRAREARNRPARPPGPDTLKRGEVLTVREVAHLFGVTTKTVRRWVDQNRIASFSTLGGHHRFPRDQFLDLPISTSDHHGPARWPPLLTGPTGIRHPGSHPSRLRTGAQPRHGNTAYDYPLIGYRRRT